MNDDDLIRAVRVGDPAALTTLYQRHIGSVWRYIHSHLSRDLASTEDLVSETFLAAIRSIQSYDSHKGNPCGWLLGIARNKLRDHLRKTIRDDGGAWTECADEGNPAADLIRAETQNAVICALDALSDEERLVLEWKYLESLTVREIAQRFGRTEKAVEAVLYRARVSFRTAYVWQQTQPK
jgi:RNA polymerase sigma-70 factor (ECF subfamily)